MPRLTNKLAIAQEVFREPPPRKSFAQRQRERRCRVCGCTEANCSGCIARTGQPCCWALDDLCSACEGK